MFLPIWRCFPFVLIPEFAFFPVLISHVVKSVAFIRFNYSVGSLPLSSDSFNVLSLSLTLLVSVYCACMPWCLSSSVECSRLSLWKFPLSALYLVYSPCCLTFSPCIFFLSLIYILGHFFGSLYRFQFILLFNSSIGFVSSVFLF